MQLAQRDTPRAADLESLVKLSHVCRDPRSRVRPPRKLLTTSRITVSPITVGFCARVNYSTIQVSRIWFKFNIEMVKGGGSWWCEQSAQFNDRAWTSIHLQGYDGSAQ
ncbi:unnamed protein product [Penicillium camemberti]|uniref:Str. FM013 n=1 Tax=Penicillium camemberti (strain FM 013) TaxID=1429867 RepID=A0A0G4PK36_PENC3|nr:unnamed protein product [Penicillium camemberti]